MMENDASKEYLEGWNDFSRGELKSPALTSSMSYLEGWIDASQLWVESGSVPNILS